MLGLLWAACSGTMEEEDQPLAFRSHLAGETGPQTGECTTHRCGERGPPTTTVFRAGGEWSATISGRSWR